MLNIADLQKFLERQYGVGNVKYLGGGSDSVAFSADGYVFRFTTKNRRIYSREADVCAFLQPYISVQIPQIDVIDNGGLFYARHKMLTGGRWSWHKFVWHPRKQRNLARSCARFFAELHSVDVDAARNAVSDMDAFQYIDFDVVRPFMSRFVPPFMLSFFKRHYVRVISDKRTQSDLAVVHLGVKGPNSVCAPDGSLCGVYDFGNCGIYERSRDIIPFLMGRNMRLYRQMCKEYYKISGVKIDTRRVRDLAELEFMSVKRWNTESGAAKMDNVHFCQRRLAAALLHFAHLPRLGFRPLLLCYMNWYARHHGK